MIIHFLELFLVILGKLKTEISSKDQQLMNIYISLKTAIQCLTVQNQSLKLKASNL